MFVRKGTVRKSRGSANRRSMRRPACSNGNHRKPHVYEDHASTGSGSYRLGVEEASATKSVSLNSLRHAHNGDTFSTHSVELHYDDERRHSPIPHHVPEIVRKTTDDLLSKPSPARSVANTVVGHGTTISVDTRKFVSADKRLSLLEATDGLYEFLYTLRYVAEQLHVTLAFGEEASLAVQATEPQGNGRYVHKFCFETEVKLMRLLHPVSETEGQLNSRNKEWQMRVRSLFSLPNGSMKTTSIMGFLKEQSYLALLPKRQFEAAKRLMSKFSLGQIIGQTGLTVKAALFRSACSIRDDELTKLWERLSSRLMSLEEYEDRVTQLKKPKVPLLLEQLQQKDIEIREMKATILSLQLQNKQLENKLKTIAKKQIDSSFSTAYEGSDDDELDSDHGLFHEDGDEMTGHSSNDVIEEEMNTSVEDGYDGGTDVEMTGHSSNDVIEEEMNTSVEDGYDGGTDVEVIESEDGIIPPSPNRNNETVSTAWIHKRKSYRGNKSAAEITNETIELEKVVVCARAILQNTQPITQPQKKQKQNPPQAACQFTPGEVVEAVEEGLWYKAKVLSVDGDKALVHWHGWGKQYDSTVKFKDIRKIEIETIPVGTEVTVFEKKYNESYTGVVESIVKDGYKIHFPDYGYTRRCRAANVKRLG